MNWGKEDDAFDPREVEKAREEKRRNEEQSGPGSIVCNRCGRIQALGAIAGSCCYYCHNTLSR